MGDGGGGGDYRSQGALKFLSRSLEPCRFVLLLLGALIFFYCEARSPFSHSWSPRALFIIARSPGAPLLRGRPEPWLEP